MNLLAIDTATERCSVAARIDGAWIERSVDTQRGHADLVLEMVDEVLRQAAVRLKDLDGIVYGRGPGAFTGVRIAVGVVQGLAYGAQLPTAGISNLAAVASQVVSQVVSKGSPILVCMDARMSEVYWAVFERGGTDARLMLSAPERVSPPSAIDVAPDSISVIAGTGLSAYPELALRFASARQIVALPRARDILLLGELELQAGRGASAFDARPVYLRDQVAFVKTA